MRAEPFEADAQLRSCRPRRTAPDGCVDEYYTSQPAPTQWVAVGLTAPSGDVAGGAPARRMLVGAGRTEAAAVAALRARCAPDNDTGEGDIG